jgi:dipeptidyl aminopeptidase/acylaminoacyl peptidase
MLLLALLVFVPQGTTSRPYTITDQVTMRRASGLAASPDGSHLAFVLRSTDVEAGRGRTDIWLVHASGGEARALTSHPENDSDPTWAKDGKSIYFLSSRSGSNQLHRVRIDGGEAEQITKLPVDIESYHLSPDEKTIVFSAETFPDCPTLACTEQRTNEIKKKKTSGRIYDALFFRHWDTWKEGKRSHLFAYTLGEDPARTRDLMSGMKMDAPSKPFGGAEEFTFTPDGKAIVFTARDPGKNEALSTDLDLFQIALDAKSAPKKLTTENRATDTLPVFSPDGKTLAYLAMARAGYEADKQTIMLRDVASGKTRPLTATWDRSAEGIEFSADGKTIYTTSDNLGQHALFAVDVASGNVMTLVNDGHISDVQVRGQAIAYLRDTLRTPADVFTLDAKGVSKQLTQVNAEALKELAMGEFEQFDFVGAGGDKVYGFIVKPIGFDAKRKYPVAYLIHGGPQGSFGNHFHYRWNPQVYAAKGYVAIMVDFHGSTGYGQAFTDAIRDDWGGKPFEDLQLGLAAATKKYGFIDDKRVCALGASYGGFMINWIAGNWPDRFKCLVNHDGNLDERFAYYDTEELWFPEWEHKGTPWDNPAGYAHHNPIDHVGKWKTPMLVVHGGKDFRVVDTQGMATFTALQRKGIPSKFLYFPDENHWVLKPHNSVLWHDTVLQWLDQWTK